MRAELKSISTINGDDPSTFMPADRCFSLWLRLYVGPAQEQGAESFDVLICSPDWLALQCEREGFVLGRHHFVVNEYRFSILRDKLAQLVGQFTGASWAEVGSKVARIGNWEFEDYVA